MYRKPFRRISSDDRGVDTTDRNAGYRVGLQTGLMQGLIDARLIGAERAAAL